MENYQYIFNFAFLLQSIQNMKSSFIFVSSVHGGHLSFCDSLLQLFLRCGGTPGAPHCMTSVCYEVGQPVSLAALPLPRLSAVISRCC